MASIINPGYYTGYSIYSQNVLIPAFLAAYSGQSAEKVTLNPFPTMPLPNWTISYNIYKPIANIWPWGQSPQLAAFARTARGTLRPAGRVSARASRGIVGDPDGDLRSVGIWVGHLGDGTDGDGADTAQPATRQATRNSSRSTPALPRHFLRRRRPLSRRSITPYPTSPPDRSDTHRSRAADADTADHGFSKRVSLVESVPASPILGPASSRAGRIVSKRIPNRGHPTARPA